MQAGIGMEKFPLVYHRTERGMREVLKGKILKKKKFIISCFSSQYLSYKLSSYKLITLPTDKGKKAMATVIPQGRYRL